MTPKIVLSGVRKLRDILASIGSKLLVLPLTNLSGKFLAASEILFLVNLLLGVGYGIGLRRGQASLVGLTESILVYTLVAFVILGVGFLVTYPLDKQGIIRAVIVESGLRQRNRISTGLVAVLLGVATAVLSTFLIGNLLFRPSAGVRSLFVSTVGLQTPFRLELGFWPLLATFVLSFVLVTALVQQSLSKKNETDTRTDLSIVEVGEHDETQIVRIRNDSDTLVDLTASKIQDSRGNYYSLERALTFRPGETLTLTLPEEFALEATELEVPAGLDVIYDDKRVTTIYALSGEMFLLEWGDDATIDQ